MTRYTIILKNGEQQALNALNKQELIKEFFDNNLKNFEEKVEKLAWKEKTLYCQEDVSSGKVERRIVGADVNPYGWRAD